MGGACAVPVSSAGLWAGGIFLSHHGPRYDYP